MAEILDDYTFLKGRPESVSKAMWDEWLDGRIRRLTLDVDFTGMTIISFRSKAHREASKRNLSLATKIEEGKHVVIKARPRDLV